MTWVRRLFGQRKLEEQFEQELRFHLEQHARELMARGIDPVAARRLAQIELGGKEQVKEACRDATGTRWVQDLWQDFRYTLRNLGQRPGFTAVAVITLALGIGASTAIFSAVHPILFAPLPYPHGERIMMIWDRLSDSTRAHVTFGTYRELAERSRLFESIAALKTWQPALSGPSDPERLEGQSVSASYFRVLGVAPAMGRDFDAAEDRTHGQRVTILSYALWQRRFNSDPAIVGRQIPLNDNLYTVLGVLPRSSENVLAPSAEIWTLLQYDATLPRDGREWGHHLAMVARLRPDASRDEARRELDAIARTPRPEFSRAPWASLNQGLIVNSLQDDVAASVKPALLVVAGAVVLVLVIACVNVTNLLLARGAQRRGEFAMRAALGAGRLRMIRQLLTESLVLAAIGGALGLLVAEYGAGVLVALSPSELPRANAIGVDSAVFIFALAITTLIGLGIGLIPAWRGRDDDLNIALRQNSRSTAGGHQRTRRALVIAEVALALVLLVSAGLMLRSLQRLFSVTPGFDSAHLLTMLVQTTGHRFDDGNFARRFLAQALEAVKQVPGVTTAAFTSLLPLSGDQFGAYGVHLENGAAGQGDNPAFRYSVSPGYIEAMGIPVRRGRSLEAHDRAGAPLAVLVNEGFAKRAFGGRDPIGQRLHAGPAAWPWATIVGVVADVKQTSLAVGQEDAFYMTADQGWFADGVMSLVVRAHGDAAQLAPAIKKAIWSVDKDQPVIRVATMESLEAKSEAQRRFVLIVFEAFALVALLLAAIGIYGVLSGSVNERMREIGVRCALGASRGDIVAMVLRQAIVLAGLGVAIGLAGAAAASKALGSLLFGISRLDPITYSAVVALLAIVAMAACWMPAWRAARVDPVKALRQE